MHCIFGQTLQTVTQSLPRLPGVFGWMEDWQERFYLIDDFSSNHLTVFNVSVVNAPIDFQYKLSQVINQNDNSDVHIHTEVSVVTWQQFETGCT